MEPKFIVSVDPGDVHNGFCFFKYNPETKVADTKIMKVLDARGLSQNLRTLWGLVEKINSENLFFVVENFRVGTSRNAIFQWNEVLTSRNIGKVELVAEWLGAACILQEPSILGMARKWAPFPLPKGHIPDDKSAWLHGVHFMMKMQWITTTDQVLLFGQERIT